MTASNNDNTSVLGCGLTPPRRIAIAQERLKDNHREIKLTFRVTVEN